MSDMRPPGSDRHDPKFADRYISMRLRVLILGGYGTFGGRLARLLAGEAPAPAWMRRWSVFGIPLPGRPAPRGNSCRYSENGRFHFHAEIAHPPTGLIPGYRGWLVPCA